MKRKKKLTSIYGIMLIILMLLIINYFSKPEEQIYEEILHQDYNKINNLLKDSKIKNGKYLIEDNIIKNDDFSKKVSIQSHGEVYKINKSNLYGYLIYSDKCYRFNQFGDNEVLDSNKCNKLENPKNMLTLISELNSNDVKKDNEFTGSHITDDYGSQYYFTGSNPDNYIIFSNKCFRIINVTKNGSTKIIFENDLNANTNNCENVAKNDSGNVGLTFWDRDKKVINSWNESSLKRIMDDWVIEEKIDMGSYDFKLDIKYLEDINWNIGLVDDDNENITDIIEDEITLKTKDKSKIGLISVSDYAKISCFSKKSNEQSCMKDNYLYKEKYNWWTINSGSEDKKTAWIIEKDGMLVNKLIPFSHEYYFGGTRPVVYLKNSIQYIGKGSEKNPYRIVDY